MMSNPIFGKTRFVNTCAGESNPYKRGIYVRTVIRRGKLNPGVWYELTDGKGEFWESNPEVLKEGSE